MNRLSFLHSLATRECRYIIGVHNSCLSNSILSITMVSDLLTTRGQVSLITHE